MDLYRIMTKILFAVKIDEMKKMLYKIGCHSFTFLKKPPRHHLPHLITRQQVNKLLQLNLPTRPIPTQRLTGDILNRLFGNHPVPNNFFPKQHCKSQTQIMMCNLKILIPIIHTKQELTFLFNFSFNMKSRK